MTEKLTQSYELEEKPLLIAEIGTGGLDTGYDISQVPEGSTIVTVDLLQGVGASSNHHDATKIEGLYTQRAEGLRARGRYVSEFRHFPVFADGREAPFKDETFDYVLLSSVISDPGITSSDAAKLIEEFWREDLKVNALVDKSFLPVVSILKKSANLGKVDLKMYDPHEKEDQINTFEIDMAAQRLARREKRQRFLARIGLRGIRTPKENE